LILTLFVSGVSRVAKGEWYPKGVDSGDGNITGKSWIEKNPRGRGGDEAK
jgi:hypothetical protein